MPAPRDGQAVPRDLEKVERLLVGLCKDKGWTLCSRMHTCIERAPGDLRHGRGVLPRGPLRRIHGFAITANNMTYAAFGDRLRFREFFPVSGAWGCIPAWGHGKGGGGPQRRATRRRAHRSDLPAAYNLYLRCGADPSHVPELEGIQALMRPVFITSFLLDNLVADDHPEAEQVVLTSASSKVAIALAHLRHLRAAAARIVGFTSSGHKSFVAGLGLCDKVVGYGELERLDAGLSTVLSDFSGDETFRRHLHERLGGDLKRSIAVGFSHFGTSSATGEVASPATESFIAVDRLRRLAATWGRERLNGRIEEQWASFAPCARAHVTVRRDHGPEGVADTYASVRRGAVPPQEGRICVL